MQIREEFEDLLFIWSETPKFELLTIGIISIFEIGFLCLLGYCLMRFV